jgi:putative phosphoesterase
MTTIVGVISDTHGLVRPEAMAVLQSCDTIVHAGDIGSPEVLEELRQIAPLRAIRGNVDLWATDMPDTDIVEIDGRRLYILHDVNALSVDPVSERIDVVISGHSHKPKISEHNGVLYLNPGSAGPRRFTLPVGLALLTISDERLDAKIVELDLRGMA